MCESGSTGTRPRVRIRQHGLYTGTGPDPATEDAVDSSHGSAEDKSPADVEARRREQRRNAAQKALTGFTGRAPKE